MQLPLVNFRFKILLGYYINYLHVFLVFSRCFYFPVLFPIDPTHSLVLSFRQTRCCFLHLIFPLIFNLVWGVHKFLCSLEFLRVSLSLSAIFSFMCGHLLFYSFYLHPCFSGHFRTRWYSLSSFAHRRHLPLSVPPIIPISFQISAGKSFDVLHKTTIAVSSFSVLHGEEFLRYNIIILSRKSFGTLRF